MDDIRKISSMQFYYLWRNFAISQLCIVATIVASHMLPYFLAPAVSLFICAMLYTVILNNETEDQPGCMVVMQTTFYSILAYTIVAIVFVVNTIWNILIIPDELVFFNYPYLPALILMPTSFIMSLFATVFKKYMPACRLCRLHNGNIYERGYYGFVSSRETNLQLFNMLGIYGILTLLVWWYYLSSYANVNQNTRDWYVFVWMVVIVVVIDELYFLVRYFNLFLDLEENDEIVTQEQLSEMKISTYMRFYVVCGEYVYINLNATDRINQKTGIYDTPFIVKKSVDGINDTFVKSIISEMTGVSGGTLKFFYGRHVQGVNKYMMLRYFYFLDGDKDEYVKFSKEGKWVAFNKIKRIYSNEPMKMSVNALADISRLSTIILTAKTYDENGIRKNPIKSYRQDITLADVRDPQIDIQDEKWIRIASFNSDSRFFKLKKFFLWFTGKSHRRQDVNC